MPKEEDMGYEERPDINVVGPYGKPPTFEAGQFGEFCPKNLLIKEKPRMIAMKMRDKM